MLRRIVRQFDNSRLGRKVLTDRKNNLRGRRRMEEQEVAPVAPPAPAVKKKVTKKKVTKKTSKK